MSSLGKHWFNNGKVNISSKSPPEGFLPGRLKCCITEEQRDKMRKRMEANRKNINYALLNVGQHWYNNGKINVRTRECPDGFVSGCLHK
jgi:hypothetical protein